MEILRELIETTVPSQHVAGDDEDVFLWQNNSYNFEKTAKHNKSSSKDKDATIIVQYRISPNISSRTIIYL